MTLVGEDRQDHAHAEPGQPAASFTSRFVASPVAAFKLKTFRKGQDEMLKPKQLGATGRAVATRER